MTVAAAWAAAKACALKGTRAGTTRAILRTKGCVAGCTSTKASSANVRVAQRSWQTARAAPAS